jgi:DNA-binding transcriptional regulator YiaG
VDVTSIHTIDDLIALSASRRSLPEPSDRRLIRERARLSQDELATFLRVDRASVSRWESGARTPTGKTLEAYVTVLQALAS